MRRIKKNNKCINKKKLKCEGTSEKRGRQRASTSFKSNLTLLKALNSFHLKEYVGVLESSDGQKEEKKKK